MIVKLNTDEGYFACDKGKLETPHFNEHSGIMLKKAGNSFGWDVNVKNGTYNISLDIGWEIGVNHINSGNVVLTIHYTNNQKFVQLKNKKLYKSSGNVLDFGQVKIPNSQVSLMFCSKVELNVLSCNIDYDNSFAETMNINHTGARLCITDVHHDKNFSGFYREFYVKKHVPYTEYCIAFNGGCFKLVLDGTPAITFEVMHNNDYESTAMASNPDAGVKKLDDKCQLVFPLKVKAKTSYKVFCKAEHDSYYNVEATMYHAFCGIANQNKWYYMGTICRSGKHNLEEVSGDIHIGQHNSHLYTRVMKYGNGWDFSDNGTITPIEHIKCYSDNDYKNSKTEFDSSTFQVRMFLGGGVHTTTPNDSYTMKRKGHKAPLTPFDFNLSEHIEIEEIEEVEEVEKTDELVELNEDGSKKVKKKVSKSKSKKPSELKKVKIINRL